jgi:hypothetical protein
MSTWTTPQDVIDRWVGNDVPDDEDLVQALIDDAEIVILSAYPGIQNRIDSGALDQARVTLVTVRMVQRLLRNPEGLNAWQQVTGPFSQQRSFSDSDIWMTSQEKLILAPANSGKAFEIDQGSSARPPMADAFTLYRDRVWKEYSGWPIV